MKVFRFLIIALVCLTPSSCLQVDGKGNVVDAKAADSLAQKTESWIREDEFYSYYYANRFKIAIRSKRPDFSDNTIHFCIAAAFTRLENDSIDGLFIENGKIVNRKVNRGLGGGMTLGDDISIWGTNEGKLLTDEWVKTFTKDSSNSFFQQIQLVREGKALPFHKDQKLFERRAVVIFTNGTSAVVESKNRITLDEFAEDLVKMGAKDALYTDMGSWDEGWYRDPKTGKKSVIGKSRLETRRQSSWLVFTK